MVKKRISAGTNNITEERKICDGGSQEENRLGVEKTHRDSADRGFHGTGVGWGMT